MLVSAFLTLLRTRIRDEYKAEYQDSELISYLNDALAYWDSTRVVAGDCLRVKALTVNPNVTVPTNFAKWAGTFPVYILNGTVYSTDGGSVTCKYYSYSDSFASLNDNINLSNPEITVLLQLATIYALNRNQFDVSTDTSLAKALQDVVAQSKVVNLV